MLNDRRWSSVNDAATYAACTPKTIRNFIGRGLLPAYRLGRKVIRVDLNDVDMILELERIPTVGDLDGAA